jgi:putative DNA primase/helicase
MTVFNIPPARPQRKEDYCTKQTTISADPNTDCPLWRAFLLRIMGDSEAMVAYLKRVCGYCLTGLTTEHVMFFCYGTGANGKSTFASVLLGILGIGRTGYAAVAPISTFTASSYEQHPTDLAMLRGVRLVVAQETEEGRNWATSRIKMMTGGDPISARFMRQDFFTYKPQFKIMVLGNHKPALNSVDEAIRRRIHFIPFTITIPEADRDLSLPEKLKAEYPSILAWMLEGAHEWRRRGLAPPPAVVDATNRYLLDEDNIGAWIADRCLIGKDACDVLVKLFASWKAWAEAHNERPGTAKDLAKALDARDDLERYQQPGTNRTAWRGIMARPSNPYDDPTYGEQTDDGRR